MAQTGVAAVTWDEGAGQFDFADNVTSSRAGVTERERAAALRAAVAERYADQVQAGERVRAARQAQLVDPEPVEWADRDEIEIPAGEPRRRFARSESRLERPEPRPEPVDWFEPETQRPARRAAADLSELPERARRPARFDGDDPFDTAENDLWGGNVALQEIAPAEPSSVFEPSSVPGGVAGRRTVTIRGQAAERYPAAGSRVERVHERFAFSPDRVAMWAVLLGVLLILVAITSAH